jgi:hypothetical protein
MTSDELRAIFSAMTARPWENERGLITAGRECVVVIGDNESANEAAIVALANHADALVKLVAACERFVDVYERGGDVSLTDVARDLSSALARVHEVPA